MPICPECHKLVHWRLGRSFYLLRDPASGEHFDRRLRCGNCGERIRITKSSNQYHSFVFAIFVGLFIWGFSLVVDKYLPHMSSLSYGLFVFSLVPLLLLSHFITWKLLIKFEKLSDDEKNLTDNRTDAETFFRPEAIFQENFRKIVRMFKR